MESGPPALCRRGWRRRIPGSGDVSGRGEVVGGPAFGAVTVGVDSSAEEGGDAEFLCYGRNTKRGDAVGVGEDENGRVLVTRGWQGSYRRRSAALRRTMRSLILRPARITTS